MAYKHRVVQGLHELIEKYGGGGHDPFMKAVWFGIKGQVPLILSTIDNSEEAIAEIEKKLREVLGIEEPLKEEPVVKLAEESVALQIKPKKAKKKAKPVAEVEVTVEPTTEETNE